jgi:hypothetical protein
VRLRDFLVQQRCRGDHQHAAGLGRDLSQGLIEQDAKVAVSDSAGCSSGVGSGVNVRRLPDSQVNDHVIGFLAAIAVRFAHTHQTQDFATRDAETLTSLNFRNLHVAATRGTGYTSIRYTERLAEIGAAPSVGTVGDSYDNSLAESTIGLFKTELIRRHGPWRTVDEVDLATLAYVDWFNHRRLHGEIGDIPPAELEATSCRQLEADTAA